MTHYQLIVAIFSGVAFLLSFYVIVRLLSNLRLSLRLRLLIAIPLALVTASHQFLLGYGAHHELPDFHAYMYISGFMTMLTVLGLLPVLCLDGVLLLHKFIIRFGESSLLFRTARYFLGIALLAVLTGVAGYSTYQAVATPQVVEVTIPVKDLPEELDGLTAVQISDLHTSPVFTAPSSQEVVAIVNGLKPDLIFDTGDVADGSATVRARDVAPLSALSAPLGVYGITGNHEYLVDFDSWYYCHQNAHHGERFLLNESRVIIHKGRSILVTGLTDENATRYSRYEGPNLDTAVQGAPYADLRILLAHQPRAAHLYSSHPLEYQVMLSGHTHAGQIWLVRPFIERANNGFVAGLYQVGRMSLYVNQGTHMWAGFLGRLGTTNEITHITFRRKR
ncbi:MAG: metallophosphoesterase [Succinivibrionaceae bacterium]|nr:metallophosphoesterase [Succinivibrionaceae bacterium]